MKIDKSGWPDGPWKQEPDEATWWRHGYRCQIIRSPQNGHLCGCVGVPRGHPIYGTEEIDGIKVHGGVTWVDYGEDSLWEIGFDCGHHGDFMPVMPEEIMNMMADDPYRDWAYVEGQVEWLAHRLRGMADGEER